jgi:hypothetical protein
MELQTVYNTVEIRGARLNSVLRGWLWTQVLSLPAVIAGAIYITPFISPIWLLALFLWLIPAAFVTFLCEVKIHTFELLLLMLAYGAGPALQMSGANSFPNNAADRIAFIAMMLLHGAYVLTAGSWGLWAAERLHFTNEWKRAALMVLGFVAPFAIVGCWFGTLLYWLGGRLSGASVVLVSIGVLVAFARIHRRAIRATHAENSIALTQ